MWTCCKRRGPNVLPLMWCGSLERGVPTQASTSSFDLMPPSTPIPMTTGVISSVSNGHKADKARKPHLEPTPPQPKARTTLLRNKIYKTIYNFQK
ncbi:hypothetical protein AVEN_13997-1 [Araneus ventricosus]|uniref:Uncharacterized protein n=1 Tax=Araneus ventricosus TaxID=182803 RepID=A0A4Y2FUY7_ARAVE|nr:hypothetical protein AVEN_13997-1 [Araneus ventricosus]